MSRVNAAERAEVAGRGYTVERYGRGWTLADPDGALLMIGDHGQVAPTEADAVREGLDRIRADGFVDLSAEGTLAGLVSTYGPDAVKRAVDRVWDLNLVGCRDDYEGTA